MKDIRPFGWVIIALNAYFVFVFFKDYDTTASDTANGFGLMILVFWLAIMNTFLYVLYRITGGKKRECPACGSKVKVGIINCSKCGFDFMKAASGQIPIETKDQQVLQVPQSEDTEAKLSKRSLLLTRVLPPVGLLLIVGYLFSAFGQDSDDSYWCPSNPKIPAFSSECDSGSGNTNEDTGWIPADFIPYDKNVAYTFIDEPDCTYSESLCIGIQVVSKTGCPNSLYGEMSYKDKSGTRIGYSNDSLNSLPAGAKGELIFDILDWERFGGFDAPKINCR
jgi:hypothetical protein